VTIWFERPDPAALNALHAGTAVERLGIEITEVGDDFLRGRMPVDERTMQPYGLLHGGASVLLAETLGTAAAIACVAPPRTCVGVEINANHVRAAREGWVTGTARPIHLGRSSQVWNIDVEQDKLVCAARLTITVVERPG